MLVSHPSVVVNNIVCSVEVCLKLEELKQQIRLLILISKSQPNTRNTSENGNLIKTNSIKLIIKIVKSNLLRCLTLQFLKMRRKAHNHLI